MPLYLTLVFFALAGLLSVATPSEEDDYPRDVIANVLRAARERRGITDELDEVGHCTSFALA